MDIEQISAVVTAVLTVARSLLYLADLLHLDRKVPALKPAMDYVGAFLGGRKERDV